jgi:hypothetical protein
MSGVPSVDPKIRKLTNAIFRSQGAVREYFTDIFPHFRATVHQFNLEALWRDTYALVITGDFEVDRVALFLDRLHSEDFERFTEFMEYTIRELKGKFHASPEELEWILLELKSLGLEWNGTQLITK